MKNTKKAFYLTSLTLLSGILAIAIAPKGKTIAKAETSTLDIVESPFFLRLSDQGSGNLYLKLSLPDFDLKDRVDGAMTVRDDNSVRLYKSVNFFDYVKINGVALHGWDTYNDIHVKWSNYAPVNLVDCYYNIIFTIKYDTSYYTSGFPIESVGLMKGFQLPSYGYYSGTSNVVYQAGCDYEAKKGSFAWDWQTIGYTDVKDIKYVQDYIESEKCGYVGFDLECDDYAGSQLEKNGNSWYNYPIKIGLGFKDYGLFSLKVNGYYAAQCGTRNEDLTQVVVPSGTIFPSRASTSMMGIGPDASHTNGGNRPSLIYQTMNTRTFNLVDGNYVCFELLEDDKANAKQELSDYVNLDDYYSEQQAAINDILSAGYDDIDDAKSVGEINTLVNSIKDDIDEVPNKAQIEAFNTYKSNAKGDLSNYVDTNDYLKEQQEALEDILKEAFNDIDKAATEAQVDAIVEEAKSQIDSLPTKEEIEAFNAYKTNAKNSLDAYVSMDDYLKEQQEEILDIIANAKEDIDNATSESQIDSIVNDAKALIDEVKTKAYVEHIIELRNSAINECNAYLEDKTYRAIEQTQIDSLLDIAKETINSTEDEDVMAVAVSEFKAAVDLLITNEQYNEYESYIDTKITEIASYKADVIYRDDENNEKNKIVSEAVVNLTNLKDQYNHREEADEIVNTSKALIDALKTASEYINEEMKQYREEAYQDVKTFNKELDTTQCNDSQLDQITDLYNQVMEDIANATSQEEIDSILETYKSSVLDIINTKPSIPENDDTKGCGGSILATSSLISVISLLGLMLLKKKEN